jgi:hypothetical protein
MPEVTWSCKLRLRNSMGEHITARPSSLTALALLTTRLYCR